MPPEPTAEQKAREALASNPFPPTPWVTVTDEGILIATGYSEALNRLLRWVPKAKWRQDKRCWLIPLSGAEAVRAVLPEITRIADAAQELNEVAAPAAGNAGNHPREPFVEAAELLHGADWRDCLVREFGASAPPDSSEGWKTLDLDRSVASALVEGLRRKAQALAAAADRLEASLVPAKESGPRQP